MRTLQILACMFVCARMCVCVCTHVCVYVCVYHTLEAHIHFCGILLLPVDCVLSLCGATGAVLTI